MTNNQGDLTLVERLALNECAQTNRNRCLYWWRPKTMARLNAKGLVEAWLPQSVAERPRMKRRPWRLTDAGRQYLARISTLNLINGAQP